LKDRNAIEEEEEEECQLYTLFFFHYLYNPLWVLAFSTRSFQAICILTYINFLVFISLKMAQFKPKHVEVMVNVNNRVYIAHKCIYLDFNKYLLRIFIFSFKPIQFFSVLSFGKSSEKEDCVQNGRSVHKVNIAEYNNGVVKIYKPEIKRPTHR
jgi:hypothetical protein